MLRVLRILPLSDKRLLLNHRFRTVITTGICSGFFYRAYVRFNQPEGYQKNVIIPPPLFPIALSPPIYPCLYGLTPPHHSLPLFVFYADEEDPYSTPQEIKSRKEAQIRLDKLMDIQTWVEKELPYLFFRDLFSSLDFFQPNTVLEFERMNGKSMFFRGPTRANCFLAVVRSFFAAVSCGRRIDVLSVRVDQDAWRVEASVRIVLLPSPKDDERNLPLDQLLPRLEPRAQWHDFRVIFNVNKAGELTHVKITRLTPPQKRFIELPFSKIRMVDSVIPFLPQPIPLICNSFEKDDIALQELLKDLGVNIKFTPQRRGLLSHVVEQSSDCLDLLLAANQHSSNRSQSSSSGNRRNSRRDTPTPLKAFPYVMALLSTFTQSLS